MVNEPCHLRMASPGGAGRLDGRVQCPPPPLLPASYGVLPHCPVLLCKAPTCPDVSLLVPCVVPQAVEEMIDEGVEHTLQRFTDEPVSD